MGGKSSFVRMIAIIALMGQVGCCVPATSAHLCAFDNIFTRMGAGRMYIECELFGFLIPCFHFVMSGDDIAIGRSTLMCELLRTNYILRSATSRSLVVIDELGRYFFAISRYSCLTLPVFRGTSTHDGVAVALSTLKYFVKNVCPSWAVHICHRLKMLCTGWMFLAVCHTLCPNLANCTIGQ
jgi:DNA mismatch repair protein MSH3